MFDFRDGSAVADFVQTHDLADNYCSSRYFVKSKRAFDIVVSVSLLPVLVGAAIVLLLANPFLNRGRLIFFQIRMGHGCKPFVAYKFRSMKDAGKVTRRAEDPLETDRISWFGNLIRKSRVDELPQLINVLKGEMSLIGPRPDCFHHARKYLRSVPGYRERHAVRPGISGLAQTEVGYVEGLDATAIKVRADIFYIRNRNFKMEMWIFYRTVATVLGRKGR